MVKTDPNYPPKHFHTQTFNLMGLAETERFVNKQLAELEHFMDAPELELPECDEEALWRSDAKYKYYKSGDTNAARSTKNFDSMQEAQFFMYGEGKGAGAIKEVPGEVKACKYCAAFPICTQKDRLIAAGHLVISNQP
jgi:hypothetical protein